MNVAHDQPDQPRDALAPGVCILRVALPLPLDRFFDYLCDDATQSDIGRSVRVPFGRGEKIGLIVDLISLEQLDIDPARLKPALAVQRDMAPMPADWLELVRFVSRYYHAPLGEVIALALPPGLRRAKLIQAEEEDPFIGVTPDGALALSTQQRESRSLALLRLIHASGPQRRSVIKALPGGKALAETQRRGWLGQVSRPYGKDQTAASPELTEEQSAVLAAIADHGPGFCCWLLQGVTGSGKTEVYLRLAAQALSRGEQVLMLVPEIALTPQLETRVASRFPAASVVSLHSAQAEGARSRGFVLAQEGRADIVLGTRLSVFTPLPRLGLVLVDEEHDASYKQQEGVRYSARDVAVWRARQRQVPVVLGSATPSLESWQHARLGRYKTVHLRSRARSDRLPVVRCLDTRRIKLDGGLSPALLKALEACLNRGEQSLVFLNRRGYAPVLSCPSCGWVSQCPNCSARLVVHLADRRLRCHHCGCDTSMPHACPVCGNQDIQPFGRGTQRIEAQLAEHFPQARVLRIDRDSARTRNQWESLLARIAGGEVDILVGTQMMAKGHDFPKLTLVGVMGADASLHAADFRAPERLFQQLMQVGGRAGRAELPGEVLIQTEFPDHPLYRCLVSHDFDRFAASELETRKEAGFPPFSYQVMLRADSPTLDDALTFLTHAQRLATELAPDSLRVFDPVPMRMVRLARRERGQLLVEADDRTSLQRFTAHWVAQLRQQRTPRDLRWQIDIDPLEV